MHPRNAARTSEGVHMVVLDACVLVPMPLADTLLRLTPGPRLYLPKWSDQIMVEVPRTRQENFGLSPKRPCTAKARSGETSPS
jgi:hypothetical protein